MSGPVHPLQLQIQQISLAAQDVISLTLRALDGAPLPVWQAGAHLELKLPSGKLRHYSLCGDLHERHSYQVAVLKDEQGRGGSREIHRDLRVGQVLAASAPRNLFALAAAPRYLFIAGGIGITPLLPMIQSVHGEQPWQLFYAGRSRHKMAFTTQLGAWPRNVQLCADDQQGPPDIAALLDKQSADTAVYCCGPAGLIKAVEAACQARGLSFTCEHFGASAAVPAPAADSQSFEVVLARSGHSVSVGPQQSILDAVKEVLPNVAYSCAAGFCGACETNILEGAVEHHDSLLSEAEQQANRSLMICVSRARCARLVLDL
jgi:ferredoxin-NADP reductase